ncbi:MAG TPA: RNA-binding S4 domain-containing protein [Longimicrobiales bacterium]
MTGQPHASAAPPADSQRLDKWLWFARFFKSRSLAARACAEGRVRVSGQVVGKAHYAVKVGDVLTFPAGPNIRVVRVAALAVRRGPAAEARRLYEDLTVGRPPMATKDGEALRP